MNKFIFLLFPFWLFAQQPKYADKTPEFKNAIAAIKEKQYNSALVTLISLKEIYPLDAEVHYELAKCNFYAGKSFDAIQDIENAITLTPTNFSFYLEGIYIASYTNFSSKIKEYALGLAGATSNTSDYNYAINYLESVINTNANNNSIKNHINNALTVFKENYSSENNYNIVFEKLSNYVEKEDTKGILSELTLLKNTANGIFEPKVFYNFCLATFYGFTDNSYEKSSVETMLYEALSKCKNPVEIAKMYLALTNFSTNYEKFNQFFFFPKEKLNFYNNEIRARLYSSLLYANIKLNKTQERLELAKKVEVLLPLLKNERTKLDFYYHLATSYQLFENDKALDLANNGLLLAKKGYSSTIYEENLISIKQILEKYKGKTTTTETSENSATDYYNLALTYFQNMEYAKMIVPLQKAKSIVEEKITSLSLEEKKNQLAFYSTICSTLLGCYIKNNNNAKAVETIESYKGFYLAQQINSTKIIKQTGITELQKALKSDEAFIYIMKSNQADEGLVFVVVVTQTNTYSVPLVYTPWLGIVYSNYKDQYIKLEVDNAKKEFRSPVYTQNPKTDNEGWLTELPNGETRRIIDVFRNHLHPNKEQYPDFKNNPKLIGTLFYKGLIEYWEKQIIGKKRLIFCLDGEFNLIPFEALMDTNKKYLIETFDISYTQNASVFVNERNRQKKTYPKNILAFGDAKYEEFAIPKREIHSLSDILRLEIEVKQSLKKKQPLDYAFKTFSGGAMNYLKGSKVEVEVIKQYVPKTDVRMDKDMTENEFKRMSNSGELKNYKTIHLSSHASVHPYIFDLTGIAFSVKATPVDGEDGMLVIEEFKDIKMDNDLVVLSACQTGLGKIVPGEGVIGLNYALFEAGAHNTITSLWSVSDYATTILTTEFYKKVFQQNKDYVTALNEVKREMLQGKFNTTQMNISHPNYWAPFIFNGR